jgi:hypothetical protein
MVGQAQVVVGTEVEDLLAIHNQPCSLRGVQGTDVGIAPDLLQVLELVL